MDGFRELNLCKDPSLICNPKYPLLKYIAGFFYWIDEPQSFQTNSTTCPSDSNYPWTSFKEHVNKYVTELDGKRSYHNEYVPITNKFIDPLSGIVNRGCSNLDKNTVLMVEDRQINFRQALTEINYPENIVNYTSSNRDERITQIINHLKNSPNWVNDCPGSIHGIFCKLTDDSGEWGEKVKQYNKDDLIEAFELVLRNGFGDDQFLIGDNLNFALLSFAGFLGQAMHETIQYDACDENNWSISTGDFIMGGPNYPVSAACGQANQDYQNYHCSPQEQKYECPGNFNMIQKANTNATWYGAPGPLFTAPNDFLGIN
jgi:hypothetical protein